MTQKTGYEIRLQLLKEAKEVLLERFNTQRDVALQRWHMLAQIAMDEKKPLPQMPEIQYVTTTDILEEAERLNEFVSLR